MMKRALFILFPFCTLAAMAAMATSGTSVNSELMLHTNQVDIADVQEIRRSLVGTNVLLLNLKTHFGRISA